MGEGLRFICQKEGPKGPAFDSNSSDQVELNLPTTELNSNIDTWL